MPRPRPTLAAQEITVVDLPTAFWHELVLYLHEERAALPPSIRLVVIGGERVDQPVAAVARPRRQARPAAQHHGCTETTMITHAVQLGGPGTEQAIATHDGDAPLGRALPHVRGSHHRRRRAADLGDVPGELLSAVAGRHRQRIPDRRPRRRPHPLVPHRRSGGARRTRAHTFPRPCGRAGESSWCAGTSGRGGDAAQRSSGRGWVRRRRRTQPGRTTLTAYVVPAGDTTAAELKSFLRATARPVRPHQNEIRCGAGIHGQRGRSTGRQRGVPPTSARARNRPMNAVRIVEIFRRVLGIQDVDVNSTSSNSAATRYWPPGC